MKPLTFPSRPHWRGWLASNHDRVTEAWVVIYKKDARGSSPTLEDLQEEALCFGWTDNKAMSLDHSRYALRLAPRRRGSVWSMVNIRRVRRLIRDRLMTGAGLAKVEEAKRNGQWAAGIKAERTHLMPSALERALRRRKGALERYRQLPRTRKRLLLHGVLTAKSSATLERRIAAIVREVR